MVRAAHIKSDMPIGTNAAQEKTDAAQGADLHFKLLAPLIDAVQYILLDLLKTRADRPVTQRKIHFAARPDLAQSLTPLKAYLGAIDQ